MAAVLQLKINNFILKTKISFLPRFLRVTTWVLIRMCTIVTSLDMTSFVYIGDESIICRNGLERKRNDPSKKKLCYLYWVIEKSKDELQKCWINQTTVSKFKKRFYCGARLKTYITSTGARGDRPWVTASFCGLGNWIDRSRQLIGVTTFYIGVVCKLILAFLHEK